MIGEAANQPSTNRPLQVQLRAVARDDLTAVNDIVTSAVLAWPMAQRLKRVALNVLRYDVLDLDDLQMLLASVAGCPAGVAAWDDQTPYSGHTGTRAALLHGLYVRPQLQRCGIGSRLQGRVAEAARSRGFDGLLVKAERVSVSYFERCGYQRVTGEAAFGLSYPYLFWRPLAAP